MFLFTIYIRFNYKNLRFTLHCKVNLPNNIIFLFVIFITTFTSFGLLIYNNYILNVWASSLFRYTPYSFELIVPLILIIHLDCVVFYLTLINTLISSGFLSNFNLSILTIEVTFHIKFIIFVWFLIIRN